MATMTAGPGAETAMAARRLVLSGPEFDLLVRRTALRLPPPFGTPRGSGGAHRAEPDKSTVDDRLAALAPGRVPGRRTDPVSGLAAEQEAVRSLVARGVIIPSGTTSRLADFRDWPARTVHPSVRANLVVLAEPRLLVRVDANLPAGRWRGIFAVAGPLGASLFGLPDGAVELSMFPAVTLGRELIRAVPTDSAVHDQAERIHQSLSGTGGGAGAGVDIAARPGGRVPLDLLAEYQAVRGLVTDDEPAPVSMPGSPVEVATAADLVARTRGVLRCVVLAQGGAGNAVGQAVWLATDAGWVGLAPHSDEDGRRMVDLRAVERADLGTWLAPAIAEILASAKPPPKPGGAGSVGSKR